MAVTVDWTAITRLAKRMRWESEYVVALTTSQTYAADLLNSVLEIDIEESPANGHWAASPKGWLLTCEGVDLDGLHAWVHRWAQALTELGVEGTITGPSLAARQMWARDLEMLQPFVARWLYVPDDVPEGWRQPWPVENHRAVATFLADWVCAAGGQSMVSIGSDAKMWAGPQTIAAVMLTDDFSLASTYHKGEQWIRVVRTRGLGRAYAYQQDRHTCWQEQIELLRDALVNAPRERLGWAAVTQQDEPQHRGARAFDLDPQSWRRRVLQPHGIQILSADHLQVAHDLSGWQVTKLDDDHYLVQDRDLGAWYATPLPYRSTHDPDLVARARADFGTAMLVQQE